MKVSPNDEPWAHRCSRVPSSAIALAVLLGACARESGCIRITQVTDVWGEAESVGVRLVARLPPGTHRYSDVRYDKDYMWYRITLPDGRVGFVIAGPEVQKAPCPRESQTPGGQ